jgi:nucleotide-binding universal stress UspA family protein
MIQRILFPVDFSPSSIAMAPYVMRAAQMFGAKVGLIYVCDLASYNGFELFVRPPQEIAAEHQAVARMRLHSFLQSEFPASTCERILRSGEAAEQISEVASGGRFDLIIMPTHAGRFRRMLLGSTVAKVLDNTDCPVLTSEHSQTIKAQSLEHRVWACALGTRDESLRVLRLACAAAAAVGARLSVIHAATPDGSATEARRQIEKLVSSAGYSVDVVVVIGPVKQALLDAALKQSADLLIIGRNRSVGISGRLCDLTYSLTRDSPFPVLSV